MNYNKLVFHEDTWPDVVGRTLTFNCKRYELELKTIEGIRSCSITMAECIAFRSRFELSHIDTWAAEYLSLALQGRNEESISLKSP